MNFAQTNDFTVLRLPESDDQPALAALNRQLAGLETARLLAWMVAEFGRGISFTTSLGAEDQIILDLLDRLVTDDSNSLPAGRPRLSTLDTGRLPPETYDVLAANGGRYPDWPIAVYFPQAEAVQAMVAGHGINLFRQSIELRKECCAIRKVEPLGRALHAATAWLSGLRRDQAPTRGELEPLAWDAGRRLWKLSPLWNWSLAMVEDYLATHDLPRNALHSRGYPSIGCAPCTRAIKPGEDERAGRWWWESPDHKECGLHQDPLADSSAAKPSVPRVAGITRLDLQD